MFTWPSASTAIARCTALVRFACTMPVMPFAQGLDPAGYPSHTRLPLGLRGEAHRLHHRPHRAVTISRFVSSAVAMFREVGLTALASRRTHNAGVEGSSPAPAIGQ